MSFREKKFLWWCCQFCRFRRFVSSTSTLSLIKIFFSISREKFFVCQSVRQFGLRSNFLSLLKHNNQHPSLSMITFLLPLAN